MFPRLTIILCLFSLPATMSWRMALLLLLGGCGAPVDPCAKIDCSEGRVCVVRSVGKVACEVPDAGASP